MRIFFKKIEIHNFMSFANEVFEFDKHKGLNLVCGRNNDIPGAKNGVGKCLDPDTKINIQVDELGILKKLLKYKYKKLNTVTLQDLYNFYKNNPEYKGKIKVQTRFGYYPIEECSYTAYNSEVIQLKTEKNKTIKASPDHLLYSENNDWIKVKNLTINNYLYTYNGLEKITEIKKLKYKKDLLDIQVAEKHEFYANGIVSHNSQLFESLCFSLYGQTRNNIKNINIKNKYTPGKEVRVVTYFQIEDINYIIASGFNKYGAPYCNLTKIIDNEEIDITKSTIIETRKFLEKEILYCDISVFLRTILLSSDQNYNFFRLRRHEKKEFIEKLFDISVFGDMYNNIHRDILDKDKELLVYQNKLLVLHKACSDYKERIEKYNIINKNKIDELNKKLNIIKENHTKLKNLNIKNNSDEVDKYQNILITITNTIDEINKNIRKLNNSNSDIELANHKFNSSKDQKQKIIDKHSELLNKLCDNCINIFKEYYNINIYIEEINDITKQINKNIKLLNINKTKIKKYNEKIIGYENKQNDIHNKIKSLTEKFNKTNKDINELETNIRITESELIKIKKDKNPYTELFNNTEKEIEEQTNELNNVSEKYKYLKFAENIVSQDTIRKFIISDLIGLLNNKIKMYLTKFGAKYNVVFDSDMNYEFIAEGHTYEYDNFSAGERARLMIATCFAFRDFMYIRNNLSSNILILDEFIDGAIDSLAIDSILDILNDFSKMWNQNIFVISHRKEIDNTIFNNIIQVVKTNNIAKITYV